MDNVNVGLTSVNPVMTGNGTQLPTQVVTQQNVVPTAQTVQNNQALFTQEQVNSIVSGRVNQYNQKITELSSQLAEVQKLSQTYLTELTGYKNKEIATNNGVPAQFLDFAVFEASKLAVNGKSFEDAIKEYVAQNGALFGVSQTANQTTTPATTPTGAQVTQDIANPAQVATGQQTQVVTAQNVTAPAGQGNNTVTQNTQQLAQANVQQVVQTPATGVGQNVAQGAVNVQTGSTGVQTAGNPAVVSNVGSDVENFLKQNGLDKVLK